MKEENSLKALVKSSTSQKGDGEFHPEREESEQIDITLQDRFVKFQVILEMQQAWNFAYSRYVAPIITKGAANEVGLSRLEEITNNLIENITQLPQKESIKLIKKFDRLSSTLKRASNKIVGSKRIKILQQVTEISKIFEKMATRAKFPSWWQRIRNRLFKSPGLNFPRSFEQRLKPIVNGMLSGMSRSIGKTLQVDQDVINAFGILGLPIWANNGEVEERFRHLAKEYHPDKFPGSDEQFKKLKEAQFMELNEARKIIKKFHTK